MASLLVEAVPLGIGFVSFDPAAPRPGDLVLVYIDDGDRDIDRAPVRAFSYEFTAFRVADDKLRAVMAVPIDTDPGDHPLEILIGGKSVRTMVRVVARKWDSSQLKVSREFTQKKSKALLARLKEEERALKAVWEVEPGPPRFTGRFRRPIEGEVTGVFGTRRVFNGKVSSVHFGLDLDGKEGDPIRAVQGGRVVMSSLRWASGGTIIIDHGGGLFTMYFHMSRRDKKPGDWVKAGEMLGAVGKTGRVTGPHLHLQVMVRTRKVDAQKSRPPHTIQVDPERVLGLELFGESKFLDSTRLAATSSSTRAGRWRVPGD
jgi:murein DD-endopeptidase MepM/ murein hydrolase activator NlpD